MSVAFLSQRLYLTIFSSTFADLATALPNIKSLALSGAYALTVRISILSKLSIAHGNIPNRMQTLTETLPYFPQLEQLAFHVDKVVGDVPENRRLVMAAYPGVKDLRSQGKVYRAIRGEDGSLVGIVEVVE